MRFFRIKMARRMGVLAKGLVLSAVMVFPAQAQWEPFLGEIKFFGGTFAPRGWALCEGQLLPISQYQALFSILGTIYGGDGRTTFALPDARGRSLVHKGNGPGLSILREGQRGGTETETLNVTQIPSHNHGASGLTASSTAVVNASTGASGNTPDDKIWGSKRRTDIYDSKPSDVVMSPDAVAVSTALSGNTANTGGNQPHNNRDPYIATNCIIAIQGTFPSRS